MTDPGGSTDSGGSTVSDATIIRIVIASTKADIDPALAHRIRKRVHGKPRITVDQAEQFIALFRQLPSKPVAIRKQD